VMVCMATSPLFRAHQNGFWQRSIKSANSCFGFGPFVPAATA
jgi:hypothetical protein